jgi:hypothetical protein
MALSDAKEKPKNTMDGLHAQLIRDLTRLHENRAEAAGAALHNVLRPERVGTTVQQRIAAGEGDLQPTARLGPAKNWQTSCSLAS